MSKPRMTEKEIRKAAKENGYRFYNKSTCPSCKHKYAIALVFGKKDHDRVLACPCGFRMIIKSTYTSKPRCATSDCNAVIGKKEIETNNGYCWKCRPPKTTTICSCGNPLPKGRTKWCYSCRPATKSSPPKEAASTKVYV